MKQCNKVLFPLGVLALFCCVMSLFGGIALGAVAPTVTALPVFKNGTVTPTRLATDSAGNIYVTDPHAEGVLKFSPVGNLLQKIITAKEPDGIAIGQDGRVLVTQGTYVVALNADGTEYQRFGTFKLAYSITVANAGPAAGRIYVSDIRDYCIQVFDSSYNPVTIAAHDPGRSTTTPVIAPKPLNSFGASALDYNKLGVLGYFNRPAGVAFEKNSNLVAVADSLTGMIQFFDPDGNPQYTLGTFGYDNNYVMFTYPQSIAFEYVAGVLNRAYVLDTNQDYVMVLNPAGSGTPLDPSTWTRLSAIGSYGHANGNLIAPSDILVDSYDPNNNRLFVSNGFGSISVFGLASLQPYNVNITSITDTSMTVNWTNSATAAKSLRVYRAASLGGPLTLVSGDLATGTVSFIDSGLAPYTTYYYTVRAVSTSNVETSNVDQVFAKTTGSFGLTVNIAGSGQVNGTVTCNTASCQSTLPADSLVTLTASPSGSSSQFVGWTGAGAYCNTQENLCQLSMDAAKVVTATFAAVSPFRVNGIFFDNLQDAYDAAQDGSIIQVMSGTWPSTWLATEFMTAWQAKTVTVVGGYDATFTSNTGGQSTITGRTNMSSGKVVFKQIKVH